MINKHLVKMHFNANARSYDLYAHVQKKMASRLIEFSNIKQVEPVNEILDIGCGTGHLTELLRKHFPTARITAVDIAPQMIEFAADKFHGRDIEFICADAQEMELSRNYDLIVSNASFQWFNNLQLTLGQLYSKLNNNGILCFSTFGDKTFNELHKSYNIAKQNLEIDMNAPPGQSFYKLDEL